MTERIDITEAAFCMFLARVRSGQVDAEDWHNFTSGPFPGYPDIEAARQRLLQIANWLGQSEECLIPPGLREAAQEILVSLDPNYG